MMKPPADNLDNLYSAVCTKLKILGVKVPKIKKLKPSSNKQERTLSKGKVFGVSLSEQEWISEDGCCLPKFPAIATKYLVTYCTSEGLFRKAGSLLRQKELKVKVENGDTCEGAQPNDVASLLKQWLRELPEPLIPFNLQDLFSRCLLLNSEENKVQSVLLSCLLLPPENLNTLAYLLNFLSGLVAHSNKNKMDAHNLAIIMTPNLLHTVPEHNEKNNIAHHMDLVQLLIVNADKVGQIPCIMEEQAQEKDGGQIDEEIAIKDLDCSPSASKRRQKSGPVYDFVHEIRKLVSQNLTPASCTRSHSAANEIQRQNKGCLHSSNKRKIDTDYSTPSTKKARQAHITNAYPAPHTPITKTPRQLKPKKTIFSPFNSSSSQAKSRLLNLRERKRGKSVTKYCQAGIKWLSAKAPGESQKQNLGSSFLSDLVAVTPPIASDCEDFGSITSPLESSTPGHSSLIFFPALGTSPRSTSIFSSATNCSLIDREKLEGRENVLPDIIKQPVRDILSVTSASTVNKLDILPKVEVLPRMAKTPISCSRIPVLTPLKVRNNITSVSEKRVVQRMSRKDRNLRNHLSPGLSESIALILEAESKKNVADSPKTVTVMTKWKSSDNCKQYLANVVNEGSGKAEVEIEPEIGSSKKGTANKSSLRRGRPNTINTGLPSEFCQRYLNESVALSKLERQEEIGNSSIMDLKNASFFLACTPTKMHEHKMYASKNIRT